MRLFFASDFSHPFLNGVLLSGLHLVQGDEADGLAFELLFDGVVMSRELLVDVASHFCLLLQLLFPLFQLVVLLLSLFDEMLGSLALCRCSLVKRHVSSTCQV